MNSKNTPLREFGKFRLDAEKKVLWFDDEPVKLALKEIELLCVLTESGGEVFTKDELLNKVWADSFVEESNLARHIYVLRKTLKEFGAENLIETVPRRGYRFAGKIREIENVELVIERHSLTKTLIEIQEEGEKGRKEEWKIKSAWKSFLLTVTGAILLLAFIGSVGFLGYRNLKAKTFTSEIKSIAVLPFETIDGEKGNEHQGLGLADVLITRLSNIKEINVRPTSAILNFDYQDSITFGEKLKTDAILEGAIYRTSDKVRVTARLIKVDDGSPIWAGQFEKPLQDELRLQDEIALQVVDALALNLSGNEKNALTKRYTESVDAFRLYQKGRYEWNKRSWQGMIDAQRLFRSAIERDPNFALAHVGLSDTIAISTEPTEAYNAVQKALELDPNLAEAHASLGFLQMFHDWRWREAETSLKKSIEFNPNYATAHHWYAQLLAIEGRNSEAKAAMRRALEINPLSYNFLADLGQIYYFAGEYKEAEEYCRKALEIYPDFTFAREYLADIYLKTGEYEKAVEEEIKAQKINLTFANESAERKKYLEADIDARRKIYREGGIKRFVENLTVGPQEPSFYYLYAARYAFLGEREKALDRLEKAFEGRGFLTAFVKADPVFSSLRDEPRYREILRKMNLGQQGEKISLTERESIIGLTALNSDKNSRSTINSKQKGRQY